MGHLHTPGSRDHAHASLATASGVILSSFHALSGPVLSPVKCWLCPEVVGLTDTPPVKGSTWLLRANACATLSFRAGSARAQCGEGAARSPEVSSSFARFPRVLCGAHLPRSQRKTQEKEITLSQNPADGWKNVQLAQNGSGSRDRVGVLAEQGRPQAENNVKGLWPRPLPCGASGIQHVFTSGPRASWRLRTGLSLDPSLRHWPLPSPFFGAGTRAGRTLGEGQLDESPPPGRVTLARAVRPRRLGPSLSPSFPVS